jgi:hypothetical protein
MIKNEYKININRKESIDTKLKYDSKKK